MTIVSLIPVRYDEMFTSYNNSHSKDTFKKDTWSLTKVRSLIERSRVIYKMNLIDFPTLLIAIVKQQPRYLFTNKNRLHSTNSLFQEQQGPKSRCKQFGSFKKVYFKRFSCVIADRTNASYLPRVSSHRSPSYR